MHPNNTSLVSQALADVLKATRTTGKKKMKEKISYTQCSEPPVKQMVISIFPKHY